jgi:hypothetical protein
MFFNFTPNLDGLTRTTRLGKFRISASRDNDVIALARLNGSTLSKANQSGSTACLVIARLTSF